MTATPRTELDPADTIGRALTLYRDNFSLLFGAALGLFALQALLVIALGGTVAGALIAAVTAMVLSLLFQGAVVEFTRDADDGTVDSSVGQLVASATPVILPILGAAIIVGIGVAIGFLLLIVPGLFLMTIWAVVIPVIVLERAGVFAALGRSRDLVKGNGWQVFGVILFVILLNLVVGGIAGAVGEGDAVRAVANWILQALVTPAAALVSAVLYLRLREVNGEPPLATGPVGQAPGTGLPG